MDLREFQGYDDDVKTLVTIHKFLHTFALSTKKILYNFFKALTMKENCSEPLTLTIHRKVCSHHQLQ